MIAGYCWPQSACANEPVTVYCHGDVSTAQMQVSRIGAEEHRVLQSSINVFEQPVTDDVASVGCDWQPTTEFMVDPAWPSGFYLVRFTATSAEQNRPEVAEAYFVVRDTRPQQALLVLSTSTWAAYNNWGGPSFYTGGHTSALCRPLPKGFLHKDKDQIHHHRIARFMDWTDAEATAFAHAEYSPWCMAAGWANWEWLFVQWIEAQGYTLGFATSSDLDQNPDLLEGYSTYLSVGHDEYWTAAMRDNVESFVDQGGNAAFFSGNTAFWQARYENEGTQLVSYKTAITEDPLYHPDHAPQLSTMWSDPLIARPESLMTGVSFTRGGYAHMPNAPRGSGGYQVQQPNHWVFDSLALSTDDAIGAPAIVVGYECDGCELVEVDDRLVAALPRSDMPDNFTVLATAPARLWETHELPGGLDDSYIGELNWVAQRLGGVDDEQTRARFAHGHAVMGHFTRGKGQVFTTGCTDWAYGLGEHDVQTITHNVLARFIK